MHGIGVGVVTSSGSHTKESGFGVDRVQTAVRTKLHPANVVTNGFGLPAWNCWDQHCEVGLATCRWECRSDVLSFAGRISELENEHVLGQPTIVAGHHRSDTECETLLAEQCVSAIARTE